MKKLQSLACYALVTPFIAFGAGSLMADEHTTPSDDDAGSMQLGEKEGQPDDNATKNDQGKSDQSSMNNTGYMDSAPANGMHASNLIGAEVMGTGDDVVGEISELIIDESGQVVALVVGVGGFLGMGEKDVAIGWGAVTRSGTGNDQELRVVLTRDDLSSAPMFQRSE